MHKPEGPDVLQLQDLPVRLTVQLYPQPLLPLQVLPALSPHQS